MFWTTATLVSCATSRRDVLILTAFFPIQWVAVYQAAADAAMAKVKGGLHHNSWFVGGRLVQAVTPSASMAVCVQGMYKHSTSEDIQEAIGTEDIQVAIRLQTFRMQLD